MSRAGGLSAVVAAMAVVGVLVFTVPAFGGTSVITQQDCNQGNITRNGQVLSRSQCEALIGQRVNLASTGFDAWIVGVVGVGLLGVALTLHRRWRRPGAQPA